MSICNENIDFDVNSLFDKKDNTNENKIVNHPEKREKSFTKNEIKEFKEGLIKFLTYEELCQKIPLISMTYLKSKTNSNSDATISIDGIDVQVNSYMDGPIYNKKSLEIWIKNITKLMNRDDFIYTEIYNLSKVLGETDRDALNGKITDDKLKIGNVTYDGVTINHLSLITN